MFKRLIVLALFGSLFIGCSLFKKIEETINAKDLVITHQDVGVTYTLPSGDFTNPADSATLWNLSLYKVFVAEILQADNSANSGNAKIGKITLDISVPSTGAEAITMENTGKTIPAGALDTLGFATSITAASHQTTVKYFVTQIAAGDSITLVINGTYDLDLISDWTVINMPEQTKKVFVDANQPTKDFLQAALDAGVFNQ